MKLLDIPKFLFIDHLIHGTNDICDISNGKLADFLFSLGTNTTGFWLLGKSDSEYLVRQVAASAYHFTRFTASLGFSAVDLTFSRFAYSLLPKVTYFSSESSFMRCYKRFMLSLVLNGGVYGEFADFIMNGIRNGVNAAGIRVSSRSDQAMSRLMMKISSSNRRFSGLRCDIPEEYSLHRVKKLFRRQTGRDFNDVFSSANTSPREFSSSYIMHDAVLLSGERVTLTVVPPHIQRMRTLDLLPFKAINSILSLVPFMPPWKKGIDAMLNRLSYNLTNEVNCRVKLLEKLRVNVRQPPGQLFRDVRRVNFPLFIPPPVLDLCTPNIMVTDRIPPKIKALDVRCSKAVTWGFINMLYDHGTIIPNIDKNNIRRERGSVTLDRFGHMVEFPSEDLHNFFNITYGMARGDEALFRTHSAKIGMRGNFDTTSLATFGEVFKRMPKGILALTEGLINVGSMARDVRRYGQISPIVAGFLAKMRNPNYTHRRFPYTILGAMGHLPM